MLNNPINNFDPDGEIVLGSGILIGGVTIGVLEGTALVLTGAGILAATVDPNGTGKALKSAGKSIKAVSNGILAGVMGIVGSLFSSEESQPKEGKKVGPKGGVKHNPSKKVHRGEINQKHQQKRFKKKQQRKKQVLQDKIKTATENWKKMSEVARKLRPELDPKNITK